MSASDREWGDYDFESAINPIKLESEHVTLVPLIPERDASEMFTLIKPHPHLLDWLPYGPFNQLSEYQQFLNDRIISDPHTVLYKILSLNPSSPSGTPTTTTAGTIALLDVYPRDKRAEIGHIIILPPFQKSHVTSESCRLLLEYCFGTLGYNRVQWKCDTRNLVSGGAARAMGFVEEGVLRMHMASKKGYRDSLFLSIVRGEWEGGVRERLEGRVERKRLEAEKRG